MLHPTATFAPLPQSIHREYERQREYLHRRIATMKKQIMEEGNQYAAELNRVMQENLSLIAELKQLRIDAKSLRQQRAAVKVRVDHPVVLWATLGVWCVCWLGGGGGAWLRFHPPLR